MNEPSGKLHQNQEDYDVEDYDPDRSELRRCSESCSHYDSLNECCWVATGKGLCQTVSEDDFCLHGFLEDDER
jgi:hypothetical protein